MSGRILVCCGPHSFPKVPDRDGSLPASLACSATLGQRHSSSLLLLPPLLSVLHLLLPSHFILIIPLQSSLFSSSPSLHDTVTTAPYYSLFKFCSGNQKHSPETALRGADHGPSARRHPGTRESKGLSRLSPHKWPWGQRSCVAHTITLTLLPLQVPLSLSFMLCLAPLPDCYFMLSLGRPVLT